MPDTPTFESPVVKTYPAAIGNGLKLSDVSETTKTIVRADPAMGERLGMRVGFGASRAEGDSLICGARPGEWMVLGSPEGAAAFVAQLDTSGHVSVVDHTHSRALFRLTGDEAADALAKVCSLDLSDAMTPNGAVTSASVAKVNCDLTRADTDQRSYLIACDRSFGQYLFDALLDAGQEFGVSVS